MNDPTAESHRQGEHRQAIALLEDLETRRKQLLAQYEQRITELDRQIQYLNSEIASLRTNSSPSLTSNLALQLNLVASHASRLGLKTRDQPKPREVEVLGRVLCHPLRLVFLETFLREESRHPAGEVRAPYYYCLGQVGTGAHRPALTFRSDGHVDCPFDGDGANCVWITKAENGVGWVIGSRD